MTLEEFNRSENELVRMQLEKCCGSVRWVNNMIQGRPYSDLNSLLEQAEVSWNAGTRTDWLEAFEQHPMIGDLDSLREKFSGSKAWAQSEQSKVDQAQDEVLIELAQLNQLYLDKFGYIFIVFATRKTAPEMLDILKARIDNPPGQELLIAAQEQLKITKLRLKKMLDLV